jgi:kynureninase
VLLPGVQYYTGQAFEIGAITRGVKALCPDIKVGFDLAHAVGNIPLSLHDWQVDFACWCSYKYLNTGPGGVAGAFVHKKYAEVDDRDLPRLEGWWGHRKEDRFKMAEEFHPSRGAFSWQLSNPAILPLATLRASMELFRRATMPALRQKSLSLTRYLELLIKLEIDSQECRIITPGFERHAERGAQLSLVFSRSVKAVHARLEENGVICDMREPDVMRIAPAPMYNSFRDVRRFVHLLRLAIEGSITEK